MSMISKKKLRSKIYERAVQTIHQSAIWQERPYTAVRVRLRYRDSVYEAIGFVKCRWYDEWDANRGIDLALRKACALLAEKLIAANYVSECCRHPSADGDEQGNLVCNVCGRVIGSI